MATVQSIREEYFRKGKNISQIAREQHVDRKTEKKFIERDDWNCSPEGVAPRSSVLDPFKNVIDEWLEDDQKRRRKQRRIAAVL